VRFQDRVVIVTGGGGEGLGELLTRRFAAEGAAVVVADVNEEAAARVAGAVRAEGGSALAVRTDVRRADDVRAMGQAARDTFGTVDILVNSAFVTSDEALVEMPEEVWRRDLDVVLTGAFLCCREVLPDMIARGEGVIVNVASVNAFAYFSNDAYSAAKAGLVSLTRGIAVRYGRDGVRANAVAPGTLRTAAWDERVAKDPQIMERIAQWYPLGRVGEPADVVGPILFLASDQASWITGSVLTVDGGLLAGNPQMARQMMETGEV
jgi:NAD(P)-dependent dehydrogenase (short-subunit alcohol dehydrogenase family)